MTRGNMENGLKFIPICCAVCGSKPIFKCSSCRQEYYCGRKHQKAHWTIHRPHCEIHRVSKAQTSLKKATKRSKKQFKLPVCSSNYLYVLDRREYSSLEEFSTRIVSSLKHVGFCVIENLLQKRNVDSCYREVQSLYSEPGRFGPGLVHIPPSVARLRDEDIRGDKVTWLGDNEKGVPAISSLVKKMDELARGCNATKQIPDSDITSKTQTMVACFPGDKRCYKKHIDNPIKDGRKLTFIFYLNKNYVAKRDGGILRIYKGNSRAFNIEPRFGRLVIFWSDKTVHEVLPSFSKRFAISVWYLDSKEREKAKERTAERENSIIHCACLAKEIDMQPDEA